MLLRTPLLSEEERLDLLSVETSAWEGAEEAVDFQNAIGWLARWACREEIAGTLSEAQHATLDQWVQKASAQASQNNYVLTSGLRLCPAKICDPALRWMIGRPTVFQTHYLLVAWLKAKLSHSDVAPIIRQWLVPFPLVAHGSFVYRSWLDAAGQEGLELVREPIRHWLAQHETLSEAQFVYRGWLDAAGEQATQEDLDLVREPIRHWLVQHETLSEAQFVYRSWLDAAAREGMELVRKPIRNWLDVKSNKELYEANFVYRSWLDAAGKQAPDEDLELVRGPIQHWLKRHQMHPETDYVYRSWMNAGGEYSFVETFVIQWLRENRNRWDATFVTKSLARQKDLPAGAVQDILVWCRTFAEDQDALWRATQLGVHLFREELAEDVVQTAEILIFARLVSAMPLQPRMSNQIDKLFSFLISGRSLQKGPLLSRVDKLFIQWLRHHASFQISAHPHRNIERKAFVERIAALLYGRQLDVDADHKSLARFLTWVNAWETRRKDSVRNLIEELSSAFPDDGLWSVV